MALKFTLPILRTYSSPACKFQADRSALKNRWVVEICRWVMENGRVAPATEPGVMKNGRVAPATERWVAYASPTVSFLFFSFFLPFFSSLLPFFSSLLPFFSSLFSSFLSSLPFFSFLLSFPLFSLFSSSLSLFARRSRAARAREARGKNSERWVPEKSVGSSISERGVRFLRPDRGFDGGFDPDPKRWVRGVRGIV